MQQLIQADLPPVSFTLQTHPALFSPQRIDAGTQAMLSQVNLQAGERVLDLCCGYGVVGIWAALQGAQVLLSDVDPVAVAVSAKNLVRNGFPPELAVQSDAFANIDQSGFDWILCNPPYHTDYGVAKRLIEKGFNRLVVGGSMVMVVKRALWYQNKLKAIFGGVRVREIDGYTVLTATRRQMQYANAKSKA